MERKIVERLRLGHGTNRISRELKVGKKRVVKIRALARKYGYLDAAEALPAYPAALFGAEEVDNRGRRASDPEQRLDAHLAWIRERLEAGWYPITVFEELPLEGISRSSFYRYLARHNLSRVGRRSRVVPEIVSAPGESLQLDWGKLCTVTENGRRRTVWMLIGVLGYSRFMLVRLVWSNSVEDTLEALKSMFEQLGGVPAKITSDNPKCFALKADRYEPLLNPAMERFASHYNTTLECLPPRTPQQKGKVERQMSYVRRLYQAHGDWVSLEESQCYLDRKLELANSRKHGTTGRQPATVFADEEQASLRRLSVIPYQIEHYHSGTVRRDGHVRFRGKYYSVGEQYTGKEVVVLGSAAAVSIFYQGKLIELHQRLVDEHRTKSTKPHHLKPWEQTLADESLLRKRARRLGEEVDAMVFRILYRGRGFIDYRKIWGILNLDKKYPAHRINEACRMALEQDRIGYQAVKEALELLDLKEQDHCVARSGSALHQRRHKFLHPIEDYARRVELTLIKGGKR